MKYVGDYPERFESIGAARTWMEAFIAWYNHEHRHSGIGWHTPASVHYDTAQDVRAARQATLDAAWAAHPERFARRPSRPGSPKARTSTTPPDDKEHPNPRNQTGHVSLDLTTTDWRDEHGTWRRYEPWMSTIVDVDTGGVLGVVDGRGAAGVAAWLAARPQEWRDRIEVAAIDPGDVPRRTT
ncbi:MAG: integrase core domain-containing protein [Kineosporiaceae bacterium]